MPTFSRAGWQFGITLSNVLNEAKSYARLSDYNHLGASDTERQTRVAEYVNQAILEFLEENPSLGESSATINLVDGTSAYSIASNVATLNQQDILRIEFSDTTAGGSYLYKPLGYLERAGVMQLPPQWRNGTTKRAYPAYWAFSGDGTNIEFYPTPGDSNRDVRVIFRQRPTAITQANVASPTGVTISEVPIPAQRAISMRVATLIANPITTQNIDKLNEEFERERVRMQRRISTAFAQVQTGADEQRPNSVIDSHRLFQGLKPLGRERYY